MYDDDPTGAWTPLRVLLTRTGKGRWLTRRTPDIVIGPGYAALGRKDGRLTRTRADHDPITDALFIDSRTGWEIDVSSAVLVARPHVERVDAHAAHHARSSREVGLPAGTTGHRRSVDALGAAVRVMRRNFRDDQLTVDLLIRVLTDEMHGRIQISGGDWGLYRPTDVDPVMARAKLWSASWLANRPRTGAGINEVYVGARIGGRDA